MVDAISIEYLVVIAKQRHYLGFKAATILGPKREKIENIVYKHIKFT